MEQLIKLAMLNVDKKTLVENLIKCKFDNDLYSRLITGMPMVTNDDILAYLKQYYSNPTIVEVENSGRFTDICCLKVTFDCEITKYCNVEHKTPFNSMKEFNEFVGDPDVCTSSTPNENCPYKYTIKQNDYNYYSPEQILSIK